ncbi:sigma-54-dependent transcriptional regulator [Desulfatitalea alkaliphila]|uniref:Sigma-54 dependent transcriptional regulator n=1 Tax=Desulfatitalea alkaliphila TaxID=2929485 RepID=A0AA41QYJ9_9BACT|nr:sigma-54 dependent transcriptional regulator [Desulfatitalea alkaliphila]MCJ8499382.1 sigma-54 dependent transcriptional regulator [Desulfatitalea alkaliphila]
MARILVVDDEERMRHLLGLMLKGSGHQVSEAGDGHAAWTMIQEKPFDMIISDIKMPRLSGMELLRRTREKEAACPIVFITAFATVDSAVEAMRLGAADYITKPFEEERILLTVERTLKLSRVLAENRALRQQLSEADAEAPIIHASEPMGRLLEMAVKVAQRASVVLIQGESGTGKELLARFIHKQSPCGQGRFVAINCAAISPHLVESELFGHEKGAFTGADRQKPGKFEYASDGTLFLDEIGDMPLEAQAKVLRTLQEKTIQRVGGNQEIPVEARIICATNQDLEVLAARGRFRQDLFYRINVVPLNMPSLRDRREDILPLARHFLERIYRGRPFALTPGAAALLQRYPWPGNVRELANAMERVAILSGQAATIDQAALDFLERRAPGCTDPDDFQLPAGGLDLERFERRLIRQALDQAAGNQSRAARLLGLTRAKFRTLMKNCRQK